MNIRNSKGFTGIDISIALIVIVIFVSIIANILYNFEVQSKAVERKSQATSIMIDILEYAKNTNFDDVNTENLIAYKEQKYNNLKGYEIEIICQNDTEVLEIETDNPTHVAKKITVNISYLVGKNTQILNIYTWIVND